MTSRNRTIDVARGLGILLVVLGHNPLVWKDSGESYRIIFSFHMPLFFFLSGIFFNPKKGFLETIREKADGLLKPYIVILLSLGLLGAIAKKQALADYMVGVILATGGTIGWTPLWFLPHLFMVILLSWVLTRAGADRPKIGHFVLAVLTLLLFIGISMIRVFWQTPISLMGSDHIMNGLPWSVDLLPVTISYFLLGHHFSSEARNFSPTLVKVATATTVFGAAHLLANQTIDLNNRQFDGFLFPVLASMSGIYLTLTASYALRSVGRTGEILAMLGSASLIILIFHWPIEGGISKMSSALPTALQVPALVLAFFAGCAIPLAIWKFIRNNRHLSLLLLPAKGHKSLSQPVTNA